MPLLRFKIIHLCFMLCGLGLVFLVGGTAHAEKITASDLDGLFGSFGAAAKVPAKVKPSANKTDGMSNILNSIGKQEKELAEQKRLRAEEERVAELKRQELAKIELEERKLRQEQEKAEREQKLLEEREAKKLARLEEEMEEARRKAKRRAEEEEDEPREHWANVAMRVIDQVGRDASKIIQDNHNRTMQFQKEQNRINREYKEKVAAQQKEFKGKQEEIKQTRAERARETERKSKELKEKRRKLEEEYTTKLASISLSSHSSGSSYSSSRSGNNLTLPATKTKSNQNSKKEPVNRYNDPNRTYTGCFRASLRGPSHYMAPVGEYIRDHFGTIVIGNIPVTSGSAKKRHLNVIEYGPQPEWDYTCDYGHTSIQKAVNNEATREGVNLPRDWEKYIKRSKLKYPVPSHYDYPK